jgi:hypothetical protein
MSALSHCDIGSELYIGAANRSNGPARSGRAQILPGYLPMHPAARRDEVLLQDVSGETLVYDRLRDTAHALAPAAAFVYRHADGATSLPELTARLSAELGVAYDEQLTAQALDELARVHLLEGHDASEAGRVTRRQAVLRLGAVLAAPLVTSLVAPAAAAAQSDDTPPPPPPPPPLNPGTGTVGYWKNQPQAWPTPTIVIGGKTYTREQAIALMDRATSSDKTYNLYEQLVAAKLNGGIGNDASCIGADIAKADAYLAAKPVGSGVKASSSSWASIAATFARLDDYNNGKLCAPHRG